MGCAASSRGKEVVPADYPEPPSAAPAGTVSASDPLPAAVVPAVSVAAAPAAAEVGDRNELARDSTTASASVTQIADKSIRLEEKRQLDRVEAVNADSELLPSTPPRAAQETLPPITSTPIAIPRTVFVGAVPSTGPSTQRKIELPEPSASPALPPAKKPSLLSSQPLPPINRRSAMMQEFDADDPELDIPVPTAAKPRALPPLSVSSLRGSAGPKASTSSTSRLLMEARAPLPPVSSSLMPLIPQSQDSGEDDVSYTWRDSKRAPGASAALRGSAARPPAAPLFASSSSAVKKEDDDFDFEEPARPAPQQQAASTSGRVPGASVTLGSGVAGSEPGGRPRAGPAAPYSQASWASTSGTGFGAAGTGTGAGFAGGGGGGLLRGPPPTPPRWGGAGAGASYDSRAPLAGGTGAAPEILVV